MVALIEPIRETRSPRSGMAGESTARAGTLPGPQTDRPQLRLIVSPGSASAPVLPSAPVPGSAPASAPALPSAPAFRFPSVAGLPAGRAALMAAMVVVVFGLLFALRLAQGQPPASTWSELIESPPSAPAVAGPGDQLWIVEGGDSFWSIALEIAPDADPRLVTARLMEANGHSSSVLQVGQRVVIPASLVHSHQAGSALSTP